MEYNPCTAHELIRLFIHTDKLHRNLVEQRMSDLNIHRSQHMMLRSISAFSEPPTQKEICEKLSISAATAAVTLKKLEASGFITKVTYKGDARCNKVSITKKGEDILLKGKEIINEIDDFSVKGLSQEELEIFSQCLIKMQNNLKENGAVFPHGSICCNKERNKDK